MKTLQHLVRLGSCDGRGFYCRRGKVEGFDTSGVELNVVDSCKMLGWFSFGVTLKWFSGVEDTFDSEKSFFLICSGKYCLFLHVQLHHHVELLAHSTVFSSEIYSRASETRARVKMFFSLPAASRLSRVGWFSRALAFRSLCYPGVKMGTTGSLVTVLQLKLTLCFFIVTEISTRENIIHTILYLLHSLKKKRTSRR